MNNHHKIIRLYGAPPKVSRIFFERKKLWWTNFFRERIDREVILNGRIRCTKK